MASERESFHRDARPPLRGLLAIALVVTVLRVAYLALACPYTLAEDEAQYWVWSRMLDWSYYTKGPGVAWVIAASTAVFGDAEWAVRLPAALAGGVAVFFVGLLGWDATRRASVGLLSSVAFLCAPVYLSIALLMTIDGPYVACWSVAAWAAHRALVLGKPRMWLVVGLAVGVGVLFKYTMLLFLAGLVAWWWLGRGEGRAEGRGGRGARAWVAIGAGLMLVAFLPVVLWNQQYGWPTVRHLLGHLGVAGGDQQVTRSDGPTTMASVGAGVLRRVGWVATYVGTQAALLGPVLLLAIWQMARVLRAVPGSVGEPGHARRSRELLVAIALPMLLFYFAVSFVTEPEGNWPIAGQVTLMPLAAMRLVEALQGQERGRRFARLAWGASVAVGLCVGLGMLRVDVLARVPGLGFIPVGRLTNADDMAGHVRELRADLRRETGMEPIVIAVHYGRASQLWYYLDRLREAGEARGVVYCSSSLMPGGRTTPWDYWPRTNLRDPVQAGALVGRAAVCVGLSGYHWEQAFARVEHVGALRGDHKKNRHAYRCFVFRGFPAGGVREDVGAAVGGAGGLDDGGERLHGAREP
jgi:4-amino-4-deoxy-L-arabinose transferase-like glycosyltransferase